MSKPTLRAVGLWARFWPLALTMLTLDLVFFLAFGMRPHAWNFLAGAGWAFVNVHMDPPSVRLVEPTRHDRHGDTAP